MLDSEYFMIFFVLILALSTIFYILYHIKHHKSFSDERIDSFKNLILETDSIRDKIPTFLISKIDMFLKYVENKSEYSIFDIERELGVELEALEEKILKIKEMQDKNEGKKMEDVLSLKKEVYRELATSLLGVLSFVVDKKVFSKSVYFVVEPKGGTFMMTRFTEELSLKDNDKVVFALIKEGVTASESKEIVIEGNIRVIDYEDKETWDNALQLFKKKSPFLANIDVLGKKKEYILLYLYPVLISYNTIAAEREGKQPVIMLKKGENIWE